MSKRSSRPSKSLARAKVLEVRVMSPRIAMYGFLDVLGSFLKIASLAAVIVAIGWGAWHGIQRAFYQNPDFRLQSLTLNPNPVIDENRLIALTGIDFSASIFEVDVKDLRRKLEALPEISAARAERHLPSTLVVKVTPRTPRAWISCPEAGLPSVKRAGGMLIDADSVAYPCPELQWESAMNLPMLELPSREKSPIIPGQRLDHPELAHSFRLLDSAREADSAAIQWIESVQQVNEWSLRLVTRQGTIATFGLGDHARQMAALRAALDHASQKGYSIHTINLIPKHNVPITLRDEAPAPKAVPVAEPQPKDRTQERRARDLSTLLNRN